ncbi:MAG: protein kinase, partial [Acidobacteria bacterium]|nr:protein kinase [Acidobacteriota bacterium]
GLFWDDLSADAMLAEPDGSVFFGTSRGLVRYDPSQDLEELPPLTLALTSMRFGSRSVTGPGPHEVPFSGRTFVAQFAAMTFREPLGVTFRYVLEGLESDPVETRLREARYFTLPAGTYTFQVTARTVDGRVSQAPARVTFTILPPWWQTLPFRIAVVGLLGLLGFGVYRLRVAQLVKGQRELETLVDSRTRLLDERNRELQEAVQQLSDAQKRILSLEEALPERLDDAAGGVLDTARDIGRMVGSESVGVYEVQGESIATLTSAGDFPAPTRAEIEYAGSRLVARPGQAPATLVPVLGPSREAHGAVLVPVALEALGPLERQLLEVFARHLGTTLELRKMRRRLRVADAERVRSLGDLEAKGIDTLRECPRCGRCYDHRSTNCEVDGQPLLAERILPFRIGGRYRLMRFLGEGGMGAVFKANDERLGRHVAVKIVRAEYLHDPTVRARLEREARLVARINHPGVVQLHDSGQLDDGSAYLVMEFLPGLDLSQMLDRFGAGTPEQVARVIAQVGDALEAAHAVGVIHRDLKPANLFLVSAPNGFQVKVVDFGLAKSMAGEGVKATRTGFVVGSPLYMSPEQVKDLDVDGRSDLFALASLSYELLTNMPAFGGTNVAEIFTYIMQRTPIALTASLKGARPELDRVFFEALEKSPDRRPRNVGDWVSRVVPLLQEVPSHVNGWPMAFGTQSGFLAPVTPP